MLYGCGIIVELLPEIYETEGRTALFPLYPWVPQVLIVLRRRVLDVPGMSLDLIFSLLEIENLGLYLIRLHPQGVFGC